MFIFPGVSDLEGSPEGPVLALLQAAEVPLPLPCPRSPLEVLEWRCREGADGSGGSNSPRPSIRNLP